jgi:hypothetical protein
VKRDKHQDLLTFSIKKMEVQRYLDLLKAVNLRPAVIMPGGYAAARFISEMTANSADFLFIDSGENNHTIYAVCSGHVRLVRTLSVAGDGNPVIRNLETTMRRTFTALQESQGIAVNPSAVFSAGPQAPLLATGNGSSTLLGVPVKAIDDLRSFPR